MVLAYFMTFSPAVAISLDKPTVFGRSKSTPTLLLLLPSAREKKRAVVAVARKLAVLLLSLWKHGTDYEPRVPATPALVLVPG